MACLLVQWTYVVSASRPLVDASVPAAVVIGLRNRVLMGMIGYGTGLVLAFISPRASMFCYVTTPLLYLLPARFDRFVRIDHRKGAPSA
jgi:hypothetical protein